MSEDFPEYADFDQKHNPAHDFIRFVKWLVNASDENFNIVFAAYARNPLGVIIASCAIEGYIHFVGKQVDLTHWDEFTKAHNPVRERIEHIYAQLKKPVTFDSGVMQQVVQLFDMRNELVHPRFQEARKEGKSPPATVFDRVDKKFPVAKSSEIAHAFRKMLLDDSQIKDLWHRVGYVEKPKPIRYKRTK
ncbi:MAG TPA: hypothetical protein VH330_09750 [Candidatus Udaeobacter sp.]|jgi:hypothetical protein